jgi:hypothetical protein
MHRLGRLAMDGVVHTDRSQNFELPGVWRKESCRGEREIDANVT